MPRYRKIRAMMEQLENVRSAQNNNTTPSNSGAGGSNNDTSHGASSVDVGDGKNGNIDSDESSTPTEERADFKK